MYSVEIKDNKDVYEYCRLNGITDINKFIQECFKQGYDIKKYGLIGNTGGVEEKIIEKEVIREVPIEKIVTKIEYICDNSQVEELQKKIEELESQNSGNNLQNNDKIQQLQITIQNLMGKIREKDKEIIDLKEKVKNNETTNEIKPAVYLRSSNLHDNLYKE